MTAAWCSEGVHSRTMSELCDPKGLGSALSYHEIVAALLFLLHVDTLGSFPLVFCSFPAQWLTGDQLTKIWDPPPHSQSEPLPP